MDLTKETTVVDGTASSVIHTHFEPLQNMSLKIGPVIANIYQRHFTKSDCKHKVFQILFMWIQMTLERKFLGTVRGRVRMHLYRPV